MKKMPPPRMRSGSRRWAIVNGKRKHYKMMDYLAWMPDRGDLTLATAILTLTSEADKAQAETAFRRAIAIAPENPDAWLGWAVALIQARDDCGVRNTQFQALTQKHYNRIVDGGGSEG
jgi:Flp pilus assembly protein TadD